MRFDSSDAIQRDVIVRLERLEARAYDSKPIWERALAEIAEVRIDLEGVKREVKEIAN